MNNNPLVSVLMTVYNRERYIAEAIKSVIASTYDNWELVIVDDQSKDKSLEIAENYAKTDERVRVYLNDKNLGDYLNRNKAASYAKGKYLKYVDADDMIYPYGLEQLVFYMEQFPEAGYGLCSFSPDKNKMFPYQMNPAEAYRFHYFKKALFIRAPLSSIINKKAFDLVNGFSGKQHVGDFEMWHKLSKKFPVVIMPQGIVWYREHEDQQMVANRTDPYVPFKYLLLAEKIVLEESTPLTIEEKTKVLKRLKFVKSQSIISAFRHHSLKKALELYNTSKLSLMDLVMNSVVLIRRKLFF